MAFSKNRHFAISFFLPLTSSIFHKNSKMTGRLGWSAALWRSKKKKKKFTVFDRHSRWLGIFRQLSSFSSFYWIDNNVSTRKLGPSSGELEKEESCLKIHSVRCGSQKRTFDWLSCYLLDATRRRTKLISCYSTVHWTNHITQCFQQSNVKKKKKKKKETQSQRIFLRFTQHKAMGTTQEVQNFNSLLSKIVTVVKRYTIKRCKTALFGKKYCFRRMFRGTRTKCQHNRT